MQIQSTDHVFRAEEQRNALQAVTAIVHIATARQLATLCDGVLQLLDQESLEGKVVPGLKVRTQPPPAAEPCVSCPVSAARRSRPAASHTACCL